MAGNIRFAVRLRSILVSVASLGLVACASTEIDPYEDFNRSMTSFNSALTTVTDTYFLKPIAQGYQATVPEPVPTLLRNFFSNLNDPWIATNQLLQGKVKLAASDLGRFLVNSTLGVAGFFDVGDDMGLAKHREDFGQTMAVWGVGRGPYLVLPLLGPSSARGLVSAYIGNFGGNLGQPVRYVDHVPTRNSLFFVQLVSLRATALGFAAGQPRRAMPEDPYLFLRDAYLQRQEFLINDGVMQQQPAD